MTATAAAGTAMAGPSDDVTLAPVTKQIARHKAAKRIDLVPPSILELRD
jgi:hypothetical protein